MRWYARLSTVTQSDMNWQDLTGQDSRWEATVRTSDVCSFKYETVLWCNRITRQPWETLNKLLHWSDDSYRWWDGDDDDGIMMRWGWWGWWDDEMRMMRWWDDEMRMMRWWDDDDEMMRWWWGDVFEQLNRTEQIIKEQTGFGIGPGLPRPGGRASQRPQTSGKVQEEQAGDIHKAEPRKRGPLEVEVRSTNLTTSDPNLNLIPPGPGKSEGTLNWLQLMKMQNIVFGKKPFAKQWCWYVDEDAKNHFWREALRKATIWVCWWRCKTSFLAGSPSQNKDSGMLVKMQSIDFGEKPFAKQRIVYVNEI